ncbi:MULTISPECIES: DUF6226 family protein [unclassified Microbacterium]|uniref:DUF6226 family protein n=1 Tax=unclassified Microbacterium TaxID=2609290 RepID=UPI0024696AA5|nr:MULTISPECIES: DUF6226 family protein [unclassified Microbacterium]MDH5132165.1 DUF6226 family protein [Microbacterium sp. RD10]MDH5135888.1 DUF6226 family protein [Microbacterium sp. RD11]MDH5143914.1 DUF6226 family protein [Microbacterium sp. RD12]MDH5153130.1 DUF6226 family protein [Microbacterium sp. RD06]MDH5164786.1 DUF6226 family protein [Microbacterium sp. RD02]
MSSAVFPGPLGQMPEAGAAAILWMPPPAEAPRPVRFVDGFEPFADFLRGLGIDPALLADDLAATWDVVAARPEILDRPDLAAAAARFVGNVIAVVHPAATWRMTSEPEIGTNTLSIPVAGLVQGMVQQPDQRDAFLQMLASWEQDDIDDEEMRALSAEDSAPAVVVVPARAYVRPALPPLTFHDDRGEVIRYGRRWPDGIAPEESYSRESHPERFAPLLLVVDALVAHLSREYEVEARRESGEDGTERVVLEPARGARVVITPTVPSVSVEAGAHFHAIVPSCICDACDETAETAADELERILLSVAVGGFREKYPVGRRAWLYTEIRSPDGDRRESSSGPAPEMPAEARERTAALLRGLDDGWWPAWPLRSTPV